MKLVRVNRMSAAETDYALETCRVREERVRRDCQSAVVDMTAVRRRICCVTPSFQRAQSFQRDKDFFRID